MNPKPISRKENIVIQEFENEILIYDLSNNKAFCLNETSALVFQFCNGENSITEISNLLSNKLKTPVSEDIIWLAIEELKREKLVLIQSKSVFDGIKRREVIRKIGLASMIALPVVFSITAPVAIAAASACSCANPGQCLTQTTCSSTVNCNASMVCAP